MATFCLFLLMVGVQMNLLGFPAMARARIICVVMITAFLSNPSVPSISQPMETMVLAIALLCGECIGFVSNRTLQAIFVSQAQEQRTVGQDDARVASSEPDHSRHPDQEGQQQEQRHQQQQAEPQQILFSTTSVADLVERHRHKQFRAIIPASVCVTGLHLALTVGPQPTDQSTIEYELRLVIAASNACALLIGGLTMTIADDRRAHATLVRLNELNNAMTCAAVVFMTKYRYQDMSVWMEVSAQPVHYCRATAVLRLACPLLSL
jgi:hypothetical protein